jgi:hypothetical protein
MEDSLLHVPGEFIDIEIQGLCDQVREFAAIYRARVSLRGSYGAIVNRVAAHHIIAPLPQGLLF